MHFITVLCLFLLVFKGALAYEINRELDGYPSGYLSNCPGIEKPTIISKRALKYLTLSVQGAGVPFIANRTTYTYFQMRKLAKDPKLDWSKRTMMYVGGYNDHPNLIFARLLGTLYNERNYNVLLLNTQRFTSFYYPIASRNIRAVGKYAADMLVKLTNEGLNPSTLEIVGLSLGGHTISFIAKSFYNMTGKKVSRLTGLDPAGSCFKNLGPDNRLDESDADFVEVVATNIDGFGMPSPVGHLNIYVNGGEWQPGDIFELPCNVLCSHIRSFSIWIAALMYPDKFVALKCDSVQQARDHDCYDRTPRETNLLGLNADKENQGIFYLATNNRFPYFLGEDGLKKENRFWYERISKYNEADVIDL